MTPTLSSQLGNGTGESASTEGGQYTVGQRQLAALGFIAVVALGFVATMAYVAGRVVRSDQAAASAAAAPAKRPVPQPQPPVQQLAKPPASDSAQKIEQLIVVEPPVAAVAAKAANSALARQAPPASPNSVTPAPATAKPTVAPTMAATPAGASAAVQAPVPAAPQQQGPATSADGENLMGKTYWQVAAVDRGMAEVSKEFLVRKGIPAKVGDASSPGTFRVLVGPVKSDTETTELKARLELEGFKPFLRRY
jgi:cell division protein FtsN